MQSLECRACGATMTGASFDRRLGVVVCDHCGAIFDLTRRADRDHLDGQPSPATKDEVDRAPVPLPDRFRVSRRGSSSLVVQWRWFRPSLLFLLFFAIIWNAAIAMMFIGTSADADDSLFTRLFPLPHAFAGLGITYYALAGILNQTKITCTKGLLKVRHGPLPWFPQPTIPVRTLEQLYVVRKVSHSKSAISVLWDVLAVTRDHRGLVIVKGLETLQQALWLEQEIEDLLDIRDRPVAGEYRGSIGEQV